MTAIPQSVSDRALPSGLIVPLQRVAQRHWFVLAAVGAIKTLIVALTLLLAAAMLLGHFQFLWMPVRVLLAVIAWGVAVWSAVVFLRPALRRWSLSRAAMHVEQFRGSTDEQMSSAVELAAETDPSFLGSPALVAHLVRQAEAEASSIKPEEVIPTDRIVRWSLLLVPVILAWLLVALIPSTSQTAMAGLYRVLMPWTNALPAVLTRVSVKPGDVTLVQGDPLDITAHVSFDSGTGRTGRAMLVRQFENGQTFTDSMQESDPHDYRIHFDSLQQTFTYKVSTDQGDSSWFTATVHPRPVITAVDVRYEYPAYTGMTSKTDTGPDGAIEALVGTRVTLTVHTLGPVVDEKSHITVDEGTPEQLTIPLKQAPGQNAYEAQLVVNHSGQYKILLTNEFDLTNAGEQSRTIVADPDEVPTIVIRSPDPQVTVRPDDTVPVQYQATDDFGVAKIEAIIQVDGHAPQTVGVKFNPVDRRNVQTPAFPISVADVLKSQNLSAADHITYQLKVTDNRDPDPQFSFSAKQTLKINQYERDSYQTKAERKVAHDLTKAIEKAIAELNQNQQRVQQVRDRDEKQHLDQWARAELHKAAEQLPQASKDLDKAADEAANTPFEDIARQVKHVAEKPMRAAAEDAAQADLNADSGRQRKEAAADSAQQITEARRQLEELLNHQTVQKAQQRAEASRDLQDAAKKQQEAADLMKPHDQIANGKDPQAHQQQHEAMVAQEQANQKLRKAIDTAAPLRDLQAQQTAQKLQELIGKVEDLHKQQAADAAQTQKQQTANELQQKANEVAKQQEALNQQIAHAAEQHKDALQKAGANPPNKDQQQNIVKDLNRNNLAQARQEMRQAADQLHQEAQQLQNQAKSDDLKPDSHQQDAMNKDQQAVQNAQNHQNQANQAADALNQKSDGDAAPKPDDAAVQNAKQQAEAIAKQAADLNAQDAAAQHDAQAAQQEAKAAGEASDQAAHAADPQQAKQALKQAAEHLKQAGNALAQAAQQQAKADKGKMLQAQKQDAQAAADQAAQEAAQQDALAKALDADQAQADQARQNSQPTEQTAQNQNQVADQIRAAQQQARDLRQQAQNAHNDDVAKRADQAQAALDQAGQHAAQAVRAEQQAAQAQQEAANAPDAAQGKVAQEKGHEALQQAGQQQQQAQDALAQAEQQLRGANSEMARADANAQNPEPPSGDAGLPNPDAANQAAQNADQAAQQAAQAAQEAAQAQQEASQQNPAAAQEAARALGRAAQAMARSMPPALEPGQLAQGPGQDEDSADGQKPSEKPSSHAGQTPDSKEGISFAALSSLTLPAAVRDIGISADQWAKLPPLARKDLMNAAQQSGPPAYREMIKDYYVRIAKLQGAGAAR